MSRLQVLASTAWLTVLVSMMIALPIYAAGLSPEITSFTPQSGEGGDTVTITGTAFTGATKVTFSGYPSAYTVVSDTKITATVPDNTSKGPIAVTTANGTVTSRTDFTINPPIITGFSPLGGSAQQPVTINGRHFSGATSVRFAGFTTAFDVVDDSTITTVMPDNAPTGTISVQTPYGTANSATKFVTDVPTISSFSPMEGCPGQVVSINGTNFTGATDVYFGGGKAEFTVRSDTLITAIVPPDAITNPIVVLTPHGYGFPYSQFVVIPPINLTITSVTPTSGDKGQVVIIKGTDFDTVWGVDFNGEFAVFNTEDSNTITAWVPENATSGKITVWTDAATASSEVDFITTCPTITAMNPPIGKPGDVIEITGTNFVPGKTWIDFTGMWASDVTVNSATSLSVTIPQGAVTGAVTVTTESGTSISADDFTVINITTTLNVTINPGAEYKGAISGIKLNYTLAGSKQYTGKLSLDDSGKAVITGVTPGTYNLTINGSHWLNRIIKGINVNGTDSVNTMLTNGDADGQNSIDLFDFVVLDTYYGSSNAMADLDGDGNINLFDYVVIDTYFGAKGD